MPQSKHRISIPTNDYHVPLKSWYNVGYRQSALLAIKCIVCDSDNEDENNDSIDNDEGYETDTTHIIQ